MHALIENNVITATRDAPAGGGWEDGQWLDFTDPAVLSEWEARHGWTPVVETPRPVDTETVKHDESVALVDGVPTQTWTARPWNTAEVAERDALLAQTEQGARDRAILDATAALMEDAHTDGAAWVQPTGAHNAFPKGATVTHAGKTWLNLTPANVWQPGDAADPQSYRWWREVVADPGPGTQPWDGNGHAYKVGDTVTYLGLTYEVLQAHTSQPGWTPTVVPSLYKVVP